VHLRYIEHLLFDRNWLAGPQLTYADLAAAAALSVADYLGEVPWAEAGEAKDWYVRMKSRPSFRPLLADEIRGMRPSAHYTDLDF
jgi:glutathione S-transferase